jgi:hypothetical protein
VDKNRYVEHAVEIDDRREPAVGKRARVRHDKKGARYLVAEVYLARVILSADGAMTSWSSRYALLVYLLGQYRRERSLGGRFIDFKKSRSAIDIVY